MLEFPSYQYGILIPLLLLLVGSSGALIFAVKEWITLFQKNEKNLVRLAILTILAPSAFYAAQCGTREFISTTYSFRNLEISKVVGMQIMKSKDESSIDNSQPRIITDPKIIRAGLESLKSCRDFSSGKENFRDGYKIRLLFDDENADRDLFLSVYRKSNQSEKAVVMPHSTANRSLNLGTFDCPDFINWTKENVDRLF